MKFDEPPEEAKANTRRNLLSTLSYMRTADGWLTYEHTAFVAAVPELMAQWPGHLLKTAWFLSMFTADQIAAMKRLDALRTGMNEKYNRYPPTPRFTASTDGRRFIAEAAALFDLLSLADTENAPLS